MGSRAEHAMLRQIRSQPWLRTVMTLPGRNRVCGFRRDRENGTQPTLQFIPLSYRTTPYLQDGPLCRRLAPGAHSAAPP